MLDTLEPLCIPVRQAIMMVRTEDRPVALTYLDLKEEDLTDIIDLYFIVDYCIRAFPLHLSESLLWDFAKTLLIEDRTPVINPWYIEDPWNFVFSQKNSTYSAIPKRTYRYINIMDTNSMPSIGNIKRFDSSQYITKLIAFYCKYSKLERAAKASADKIYSLERTNNDRVIFENEELQRRAQSTSSVTVDWGYIQKFDSSTLLIITAMLISQCHLLP